MRLALTSPDTIIQFCTDGVHSTVPLNISVPAEKTLGLWDYEIDKNGKVPIGGTFVQSGYYHYNIPNKAGVTKARGFNQTGGDVADTFNRTIPGAWRKGQRKIVTPYKQYITFGAACSSVERYELAGHWQTTRRALTIDHAGHKRVGMEKPNERADRLCRTWPPAAICGIMSAAVTLDWIEEANEEADLARENEALDARWSSNLDTED